MTEYQKKLKRVTVTLEPIKTLSQVRDSYLLINLKDVGLEDRKIMIHYRDTEDELFMEMSEYIELGKTKIHLP